MRPRRRSTHPSLANMVARYLLAALLVGTWLHATVSAQVNTEEMRRSERTEGVGMELSASGAYASGNTSFLLLGLGSRVDVALGADEAFVVGRFTLSKADGAVFRDQAFLHARYNNAINSFLIGEVFAQAEQNAQQLLEQRFLIGAGTRIQFLRSKQAGLALGVTPMFEYEQLSLEPRQESETLFRVSGYLSGRFSLNDDTSLNAVAYVQPRMNDFGDVRVLSEASLDARLTKHVNIRVRTNFRYDSQPPGSLQRRDFSIENGLTLRIKPGDA